MNFGDATNPAISTVGENLRPALFDDGGNFPGRLFQPKGECNHAPDGSPANQVEAPGDGLSRLFFQPRQNSGGIQATESAARQSENVESFQVFSHFPNISLVYGNIKCPNKKNQKVIIFDILGKNVLYNPHTNAFLALKFPHAGQPRKPNQAVPGHFR